jgi:hypothetical protein
MHFIIYTNLQLGAAIFVYSPEIGRRARSRNSGAIHRVRSVAGSTDLKF